MSIVLCLAGDAMLGRAVGSALTSARPHVAFAPEIKAAVAEADLFVANLECCITQSGTRWPSTDKQFYFRAPPEAADALAQLGVHCVTLANNHVLDFGREALHDTLRHLTEAGIRFVGAGPDLTSARAPVTLDAAGFRLAVVAVTDHPADYTATETDAGVAYADLSRGVPSWVIDTLAAARTNADAVLLSPHWGPNLTMRPPRHVRSAAATLGGHATLIAGHSAHVFHGVEGTVLYDIGDFINDYASAEGSRSLMRGALRKLRRELTGVTTDVAATLSRGRSTPIDRTAGSFLQTQRWRLTNAMRMVRARTLRSDLGLLFFVTMDQGGPQRLEALPIKLERCHTRLAVGEDAAFVHRRFSAACSGFGTAVSREGDRSVIVWGA